MMITFWPWRLVLCFSLGDGVTYPTRTVDNDDDNLLAARQRWMEEGGDEFGSGKNGACWEWVSVWPFVANEALNGKQHCHVEARCTLRGHLWLWNWALLAVPLYSMGTSPESKGVLPLGHHLKVRKSCLWDITWKRVLPSGHYLKVRESCLQDITWM